MEKLMLKQQDARHALSTLEAIMHEPFTLIIRDAAIQRFEYTFVALWEFSKEYLQVQEGIMANSPKTVFRELLTVGLLTEEEAAAFLEMTDSRNDTAHTYKEAVAETIYAQLPRYILLMQNLLAKEKVSPADR